VIVDFHTQVDEAQLYGWIDPPEKLVPPLDDAGIDRAVCMTATRVERIIRASFQRPVRTAARSARMSETARAAVEGGNARRIFGLD
jgi:hypothetical protein